MKGETSTGKGSLPDVGTGDVPHDMSEGFKSKYSKGNEFDDLDALIRSIQKDVEGLSFGLQKVCTTSLPGMCCLL